MKRATWAHPDVEAVSEVLPELRAEACITVAEDGALKTVVLDSVLPELIRSFFSCSFFESVHQVDNISGSICVCKNLIINDALP